jgi:hypothetical protein
VKYVEEAFCRRAEVGREARHLPAAVYNLARLLLTRAPQGCLFVPIRAMQYLAVLDREEFIFVDREGGRFIELAWREFQAGERSALDAPVAYAAVYYSPAAAAVMARLQGEFARALTQLEGREAPPGPARVIKLTASS